MTEPLTAAPARRRGNPALLQRQVRDIHTYLGMLFAPSLLFFAVTGSLQLFGLHEVRPGRDFQPPALFQRLGMAHKDQTFALPRRRAPRKAGPPGGADAAAAAEHDDHDAQDTHEAQDTAAASHAHNAPAEAKQAAPWNVTALKWVFLAAALGLIVSTCLGLWVGLTFGRNRRLAWGLLIAGVAVPVLLLAV